MTIKITKSQAGFSLITSFLIVALIGITTFAGWRVYQNSKTERSTTKNTIKDVPAATSSLTFDSQKECEEKTGKVCSFQMCDYIPEGKTFDEVCGKGFKEGWASTSAPLLVIGSTVTVRGVIDENVTKYAATDGEAYLRLGTAAGEIKVVYNPGEAECRNPIGEAFNLETQKVEVYGKVTSENTISTCESKDFFIKIVDAL